MPKHGKKNPYADPEKAEDVIQAEFGHRLEKKEQPEWIEGGKMFDYQLEGMKYVPHRPFNNSWLYFQWYKQTSAILADEMGLGTPMRRYLYQGKLSR
jgi:SNF2 family DNA or RNA helicase